MNTIESLYQLYEQSGVVFTDSRNVIQGGIFFALKGDRFDGNQYAQSAIEAGAVAAVVDDPKVVDGDPYFLVEDSLEALQSLARYHRSQFSFPVIGITGSNGKTTTKELVNKVLTTTYNTFFTQGNYNNHIGVPLTLLSIPLSCEMAVIEMGANHVGEIEFLCSISNPTHGLITNIGKAHLEGFGGVEGIKKGKSELYRSLQKSDGVAFINADEKFLDELSIGINSRIFYGRMGKDYTIQLETEEPFVVASYINQKGIEIKIDSQLVGKHNFNNITTAIAIGKHFNVSDENIQKAIGAYVPENNRSQLVQKGSNQIILDAYNANPTSMKNALDLLISKQHNNKIAILGDMLELGEYAEEEHLKIMELAAHKSIHRLILVGPIFNKLADTKGLLSFTDVVELKDWWKTQKVEDALILIKGSRGIKLELLIS